MKRTLLTICTLALLTAAPASAQLDMNNYVALGDNFTAGMVSGGLVDCYQNLSYPALLAQQANAPIFEMPLISAPGVPSVLQLVSLVNGPVIEPVGDFMDAFPYNVTYPLPYNNLGVPGANLYEMLFQIGDIGNLAAGDFDKIMFDLILRIPQVQDPISGELLDFTAITQAVALQPTFVTMWIGTNDLFPAVFTGTPIDGITVTPLEIFEWLYPQAVGALVTQTSADIVLFTIPDVTELAFATTVPPFLDIPGIGLVPIMGTNGPLSADSRVTLLAADLLAQGYGVPLPGFPPLPEDFNLITGELGYVLRPDEIQALKNRVAGFNAIIEATAAEFGLPVFDAGGLFDEINFGGGVTRQPAAVRPCGARRNAGRFPQRRLRCGHRVHQPLRLHVRKPVHPASRPDGSRRQERGLLSGGTGSPGGSVHAGSAGAQSDGIDRGHRLTSVIFESPDGPGTRPGRFFARPGGERFERNCGAPVSALIAIHEACGVNCAITSEDQGTFCAAGHTSSLEPRVTIRDGGST